MTSKTHSTAPAEFPAIPQKARSAVGEAIDTINRADCLVELINMAAESGQITGDAGNAIAWCCIHIRELLNTAKKGLAAVVAKGGAE